MGLIGMKLQCTESLRASQEAIYHFSLSVNPSRQFCVEPSEDQYPNIKPDAYCVSSKDWI